jgi:hypothetical protein
MGRSKTGRERKVVPGHNGAVATRTPTDDLYQALGVERGATPEELNSAFRRRARELHPDVRPPLPPDLSADEAFKRVSQAYSVLRNPQQRARYDAGLDAARAAAAAPRWGADAPVESPLRRRGLTVRGARWVLAGGIALVMLGALAAVWVVALQRHDSDLLANGVPVRAVVVEMGGKRLFEFRTRSGETVRTQEATKSGVEQAAPGDVVHVRYDRSDPSQVVLDTSHTARNVTLWIVAVKFLAGGAFLLWFGARRLLA